MEPFLIFPNWESAVAQAWVSITFYFIVIRAHNAAIAILTAFWPQSVRPRALIALSIAGNELEDFIKQCLVAIFVGRALYTLAHLVVEYPHEIAAFVQIYIILPANLAWQYCTRSLPGKILVCCCCLFNRMRHSWDRSSFRSQAKAFLGSFSTRVCHYHEKEPEIDAPTLPSCGLLGPAGSNGAPGYVMVPESFLSRIEALLGMLDIDEDADDEPDEPLDDEDTGYDGDNGSSNSDEDSDREPEDSDTDTGDLPTTYSKRDDLDDDEGSSGSVLSTSSNNASPRYEKMATGLPLGGIVSYDRRVYERDLAFRSSWKKSSLDSLDRLEALRGSLSPSSIVSSLEGGEGNQSDDVMVRGEKAAQAVSPLEIQTNAMNKVLTDDIVELIGSTLNETPVESCLVSTWIFSSQESTVSC